MATVIVGQTVIVSHILYGILRYYLVNFSDAYTQASETAGQPYAKVLKKQPYLREGGNLIRMSSISTKMTTFCDKLNSGIYNDESKGTTVDENRQILAMTDNINNKIQWQTLQGLDRKRTATFRSRRSDIIVD